MKFEDKYDLGKTFILIAVFVLIAWTASGCTTTGGNKEQREHQRVERANRCTEMALSCRAVGGTLVSLNGGSMMQCNRGSRSAMYCPDLVK